MSEAAESRHLTQNQQERRDRILAAARELVAEFGYEGMIVRDVADRANVSPTTVYNLYNTKNELLLAALRGKMAASWNRPIHDYEGTGYEYLLQMMEGSVIQTRESPAYANAITCALMGASSNDPLVEVLMLDLRLRLVDILSLMVDNGELLPDTDLKAIGTALISAFWSSYLLMSKDLLDVDELERQLTRGYLSVLIPVARGKAKRDLTARYQRLEQTR